MDRKRTHAVSGVAVVTESYLGKSQNLDRRVVPAKCPSSRQMRSGTCCVPTEALGVGDAGKSQFLRILERLFHRPIQ